LHPARWSRALALAPTLVAVDSGADTALAVGAMPERVVGDLRFDQRRRPGRRLGAARLLHLPGQDDTDFDKALSVVQAPFLLALGFTGARLDHTLAGMSTLMRNPDARVVLDSGDRPVLSRPAVDCASRASNRGSMAEKSRPAVLVLDEAAA
jgi:thiamine pyrophosphokinase